MRPSQQHSNVHGSPLVLHARFATQSDKPPASENAQDGNDSVRLEMAQRWDRIDAKWREIEARWTEIEIEWKSMEETVPQIEERWMEMEAKWRALLARWDEIASSRKAMQQRWDELQIDSKWSDINRTWAEIEKAETGLTTDAQPTAHPDPQPPSWSAAPAVADPMRAIKAMPITEPAVTAALAGDNESRDADRGRAAATASSREQELAAAQTSEPMVDAGYDGLDTKIDMQTAIKSMPREYEQMSNDVLVLLASQQDYRACRERMTREIVFVDKVSYTQAAEHALQMKDEIAQIQTVGRVPYAAGMAVAIVGGAASIPLVFGRQTALWFNEQYVHFQDIPEDADLETWLEVGNWTWGWMEPPIGTISFVLLVLQFSRNQLENIWAERAGPLAALLRSMRQKKLVARYPQYHPKVVADWADVCGQL